MSSSIQTADRDIMCKEDVLRSCGGENILLELRQLETCPRGVYRSFHCLRYPSVLVAHNTESSSVCNVRYTANSKSIYHLINFSVSKQYNLSFRTHCLHT